MSANDDLRRAARAGRRAVRRGLAPGMAGWIERFASAQSQPESAWALAGILAASALALEEAFSHSGVEVQAIIWRLHEMLGAGRAAAMASTQTAQSAQIGKSGRPDSSGADPFDDFAPWIESQVGGQGAAVGDPDSFEALITRWIDVASERLTLRRYHRADLRRRHAAVLIAAPIEAILALDESTGTAQEETTAEELDAPREEIISFAEALLAVWDLVEAERLAPVGVNRLAPADSAGFGGFYAMAEEMESVGEDEIERRVGEFAESLEALSAGGLPRPLQPHAEAVIDDIKSELARRASEGRWSRAFEPKSPEMRRRDPGLWEKIKGKLVL